MQECVISGKALCSLDTAMLRKPIGPITAITDVKVTSKEFDPYM